MGTTSRTLSVIVLVLLAIGIVMLASTSGVKGSFFRGDSQYYVKRQLMWLVVAFATGAILLYFDYHRWQKIIVPAVVVCIVLLGLVLVPGIGKVHGGSRRWLELSPLRFQPSELAKLATIVGMAWWMSRLGPKADRFLEGFMYPAAGLGAVLLLTIMEPDFGTTFLLAAVGSAIMLAGGTRLRYLMLAGTAGLAAFAVAIAMDPVRMRRIKAFFDPESSPEAAYHAAQSQIAFILGGPFGKGLGESMQKQFYLPEAQTDFIFAIIGEELGFIATALIVLLFTGILISGLLISLRAPDRFGSLIAFGATLVIVLQAAINIGVVTGCLPTKGLPLPFISYGGSSLVMSVGAICLLLNVACHSETPEDDEHVRPVRDRLRWF